MSGRLKGAYELWAEMSLWQRIARTVWHFFGRPWGVDPNFSWSEKAAREFFPGLDMGGQAIAMAEVVETVEKLVLPHVMSSGLETWRESPKLLDVPKETAAFMLMNWSGCLDAAKCIALRTGSGRNWPWLRRRWSYVIEERCARSQGYIQGVVAAVAFKRGRGEPISFLGIPKCSIIRRGVAAYERALAEQRSEVTAEAAKTVLG